MREAEETPDIALHIPLEEQLRLVRSDCSAENKLCELCELDIRERDEQSGNYRD